MSGFINNVQFVYVLAAACFVIGLHLMNSPATARRGNQVSALPQVPVRREVLLARAHAATLD